ncbi:MAG TPA: ATP-binding protein [Candidatus Methylomirabilis sp.]|nr:ATP-binding protein [Candidatus Methylomirabilis sp.]
MRATNGNPGKSSLGWWDYPATVLLLGVLSLAMLAWTDQLGQRLRVNQFSSDTLRDLSTRAATAHLWLEEGLTDGAEAKLQRSRTDLAEAIRLSQVLLDGGEAEYGRAVQPLAAPALRRRVEELTRLLLDLRVRAQERTEVQAGIGSPLDMRFNAVFEEFRSRAVDLERTLEENQAADHAKARRLFYGMLVAWSSILGVSILGLARRERRRRQAEEALRTSEERLTAIVATAMDAIITVDEDQRVVLFNAAAEKVFGCPASDAIGEPLDRFIPECFRRIQRSHVNALGTTGATARSMGSPGRLSGLRANGEEFPLETTISQASARGQQLYTVILRDITQREKAEEVAKLYAKTREREQLRMEFFANISHELRTPLALILGPVGKILEAGGLAYDVRRGLEVVERNARLLLRHVNDLLDLAKIDAARMAPKYAEIDLAQLTEVTASNFKSLAAERDMAYVIDAPDSLVADVDPSQVERALLNLLSNAFKFTPAGGSVRVAVRSEGDRAVLEVEDTGPGVPPHLREAIFERFRQVESGSARRFGGTGLGLSIAKEFVTLHGGSITVGDPPGGKGSLFRVELPLRAPSGREVRRTAAQQPDGAPEPQMVEELGLRSPARHQPGQAPPGSPVVLVVEDNPDMNAFIATMLSGTYHVVSAFDGQEALEKALKLPPDLILCDVMMPRMSGDEMVRELRRCRALDDVPIVLLTARVDDEALRVALLKEGAQDYLNKPFSAEHLLAKVERLIADRRRAAEQLQRTREVSARLLMVHDRERKRIAEELNENIAQCLALLGMNLSLARKEDAGTSLEVQRLLAEGLELLQRSSESIRAVCNVLHPRPLDHLGLRAAIEWHVKNFARRSGIAVTLDIPRDLDGLPAELELGLFRIMEEALTNVRHHSGSARATVRVFHDVSEVGLEVTDEGHGMPTAEAEAAETTSRGTGIPTMRERARGLGGWIEVLSGNKGTSVKAVIPLPAESRSLSLVPS